MGCNGSRIVPIASNNRPITIALLGLDHAGKSTTAKVLEKTSVESVTPTIGFAQYVVQHNNGRVKLYDLGGSKSFRDAWRHYYDDTYGVIYVIDCSQQDRFDENRQVLQNLLQDEKIQNKPFLILANKQDTIEALHKNTILQNLDIEQLLTENRTLYRLELCTAKLPGENAPMDPAIQNGFNWLVTTIHENYSILHQRVQQDVQKRTEAEQKAKDERKALVEKIRKERDEQEGKENDDDDDHPTTNGFVPIGQAIENAEKNSTLHTTDDIEKTKF